MDSGLTLRVESDGSADYITIFYDFLWSTL